MVRHPTDVPRPDAELLGDLFLRPLGGPVVQEGRGLHLGQEEVVVLDGEGEIGLFDFLLDPGVVAATQVQLRHVRRRADRPQVEDRIVPRLAEGIAHLDRAQGIDVEVACPLSEESRFEEAVLSMDELLLR